MSVRAISAILDSRDSSGNKRMVAVILADMADDFGCCYPRVDTVAERACVSTRTVLRVLAELEAEGRVLVYRRHSSSRPSIYFLRYEGILTPPADHRFALEWAVIQKNAGVSPVTPPDTVVTTPLTLVSQEEPSVEPSESKTPLIAPPPLALLPDQPPSGGTKKERKKPVTSMPDPWEFGSAEWQAAKKRYWEMGAADREFDAFKSYHASRGNKFASWHQAWVNWLVNAERYREERNRK